MRILPVLLLVPAAALATPVVVTHSGYLLDGDDAPVTAPALAISFTIWDGASGGAQVWPSSGSSACTAAVRAGYYAVTLDGSLSTGCGAGLSSTDLAPGSDRWLQVTVDTTDLLPRTRLSSAPAALDAALLGGHAPAFFHDAANLTGTVAAGVTWGGAAIADAYVASAAAWHAKLSVVNDSTVSASSLSGDRVKAGTLPVDRISGTIPDTSIASAAAWNAKLAVVNDTTVAASSLSGDRVKVGTLPADRLSGTIGDAQVGTISRSKLSGPDTLGMAQPASPAEGTLYYDTTAHELRVWDGVRWAAVYRRSPCGDTAANAAPSCKAIKDNCSGVTDGTFYVKPGGGAAVRVWCDLTNGGWTLCSNFVDTSGDELSGGYSTFQFGSDWSGGWNGTVPTEAPVLGSSGTINCTSAALAMGATEARFECTTANGSASTITPAASWSVALGSPATLVAGTVFATQRIQSHGEWGWGGYSHASWVFDDAAYPNCGGNSCGFDATAWASNISIELAGGYDSPGCSGGCQAHPQNYAGAEEGGSCNGVNTRSVAGERYSIFVR